MCFLWKLGPISFLLMAVIVEYYAMAAHIFSRSLNTTKTRWAKYQVCMVRFQLCRHYIPSVTTFSTLQTSHSWEDSSHESDASPTYLPEPNSLRLRDWGTPLKSGFDHDLEPQCLSTAQKGNARRIKNPKMGA